MSKGVESYVTLACIEDIIKVFVTASGVVMEIVIAL